ncbi:MAG: YeeE/YedE thiosulfate transporter family protein [Xanthomonadaceae bacterium]|nr:YeeE/YedE thiosulfate transporter family protein [Xanthomonadaceae bacterium]
MIEASLVEAAKAVGGGVLIGTAAVALLWLNGRLAGVSGIASGVLTGFRGDRLWRALFVLGLIVGAGGYVAITGDAPPIREDFSRPALLIAGLLVGYGTAAANGCTSGHGVCGLGRLSPRSLAGTATFVGVAMLTTFAVRHLLAVAP